MNEALVHTKAVDDINGFIYKKTYEIAQRLGIGPQVDSVEEFYMAISKDDETIEQISNAIAPLITAETGIPTPASKYLVKYAIKSTGKDAQKTFKRINKRANKNKETIQEMKTMTYKVSDIRSMIQESSNEFKAKLGPGVKSGNETNNGKAYKDAEKRAKDYDGGLADSIEVAKYDKTKEGDQNRTMLDYEVDNVDQKYKERIKAQALGYTSKAEMDNGIDKQGDFEGNKRIFDAVKDDADKWKDDREMVKRAGLTARTTPQDTFKHDSLYEGKNVKTAYFKKTTFLTEGHMMSRIPDEFKVEENVFRMKDKTGNEYLLEWKNGKAEIIAHSNKQGMNESIDRMKALMGYKASDYYKNTTASSRLSEENEAFTDTLDKARKIIK